MKNTSIEINQLRNQLLRYLKSLEDKARIEDVERFYREFGQGILVPKSSVNENPRIIIFNLINEAEFNLSSGIKSLIGSDSTLINAVGDNTNFIYKISGISMANAISVNTLGKFKNKFELLDKLGAKIDFYGVACQGLHNNLTMLDLGMEKIVAECLLLYYRGKAKTIEEAISIVNEIDPLGIGVKATQPMYEYKVKQFLLAFALGMTASKPWQGKFNANGGFIVVKEDGDIVCYHFFDRNDLEDYLFYNTRFETPSTSRHNFGSIYEKNDEFFMKLNLQVRFKR